MQAKRSELPQRSQPSTAPPLLAPPEPQSLSPPIDNETEIASESVSEIASVSRAFVKVRRVARSTVITLPVDICRGLDLITGDRVLLTLEDHCLKVTKE